MCPAQFTPFTQPPLPPTPSHPTKAELVPRLSAISAITISPKRCRLGLVFQVHRENICSHHVVTFLRLVHRRLGNGLLVVMDRLGAHRAAVRRLHEAGADWLDVEWLPAYAPDLNPDEQVWNHAKYSEKGQLPA